MFIAEFESASLCWQVAYALALVLINTVCVCTLINCMDMFAYDSMALKTSMTSATFVTLSKINCLDLWLLDIQQNVILHVLYVLYNV